MKLSFFIILLFVFGIINNSNAQEVNPFNGSFNYGTPLLSVPSNRGNAIPIGINYGGNGIGVSQSASEVGLGWGLSAGGSITRSIGGIADDFKGSLFNQATKTFVNQSGTLFGPTSFDVLTSFRNLDSLAFYYPNYDSYNVSGPGIGGSMTPMLLNYLAFSRDSYGGFNYDPEMSEPFVKPQFIFNGDFCDTLVSRHYPNTPVDNTTPFKMPKDLVSGNYYNNSVPYFGKKGTTDVENYDPVNNRLATSNYVEYFSNGRIDSISIQDIPNFIDFKSNHSRSSTDFPSKSIGAFRITNSAGFTYHYSLPVYSNSSTNYCYPLNNDYSMIAYTHRFSADSKIGTANQYYVEHDYGSGKTFITEFKESNRIAHEWKLTAITGPDYEDLNSNHLVDNGDKGYWVGFDYKLWNSNFPVRYPAYGFNYSFSLDSKTANYAINFPKKFSGKYGTASLMEQEVYYLNEIRTTSHKALFIHDIREDEVANNPSYDSGIHDSVKVNQVGNISSWHGSMFDEGGTSNYPSYPAGSTNDYVKTVELGSISTVTLNFREFSMAQTGSNYDRLHIYAGNSTSSPEISFTHNSITYNSPFHAPSTIPGLNIDVVLTNYTATAITFKIEKIGTYNSQNSGNGFNVEWHASGRKTPALYLKRIMLYDVNKTMPAGLPLSNANTDFDLVNTTNSINPLYNETWYQSNKLYLDDNSLMGTFLEYDYSLSKKYHRNIHCKDYYKHTRLSSPDQVQQNIQVTNVVQGTGKLTLKKIRTTGLKNVQLVPSIKFDYNDTSLVDNPNYDPRKVDNWGYYKSDVSTYAYYGYVTSTSKDYTDAWSLRKIISPMGGITEVEYESNSYDRVFKGNGGHRGPVRIYPIASLSTNQSENLKLNLEEGNNLSEDLAEVYNSNASTYSITTDVFIPVNKDPIHSDGYTTGLVNYFGTLDYTYNSTNPLPIKVNFIEKSSEATIDYPIFSSCSNLVSGQFANLNIVADNNHMYTGNGWIRFNMPVGKIVYGGGTRVRKIINRNGTKDTYSTLYEYEGGVALNEADRFANPVYRYNTMSNCATPEKLHAYGTDRFEMSEGIGYSKVKVKNLGQVNTAKGWTEKYFNTSDQIQHYFLSELFVDNYKVNISSGAGHTSTLSPQGVNTPTICSRRDSGFVVEYVDRYSPFWGLTKEERTYDVNNNILNKTVYEYASTEQGALVENFAFPIAYNSITPYSNQRVIRNGEPGNPYDPPFPCIVCDPLIDPCEPFRLNRSIYQVCIKRQYPAVLSRTTSYGMGTKTITETLKRDEITGEATAVRTIGDNNSTSLTFKVPAFRIPSYQSMGPKSVNPIYKNILGSDAYHYTVIDSTISNENFAEASVSVSTQNALVRGYNNATLNFENTHTTLPYWINNASFQWVGNRESLDEVGLYNRSELLSNSFNFSSPFSNDTKWRLGSAVTLIDDKGHIIESRNYSNQFRATKFDISGNYILAEASNCNYESFTYTGFENGITGIVDGEVKMPSNSFIDNSILPHTGKSVVKVTAAGIGPNYKVSYQGIGSYGEELGLLRGRIYRASVWVDSVNSDPSANLVLSVDGSVDGNAYNQNVVMNINAPNAVRVNSWKLLYVDVKVPANFELGGELTAYLETPSGISYFDDFQLHPIESATSAKVYDYLTGRITADIDAEGYATKYFYDEVGRLITTYKEIPNLGTKRIKKTTYNYARGTD